MCKFILTILFWKTVFTFDIFAQTIVSIQTDRPDQTESAFTVPKSHSQIELGYTYEKVDDINNSINFSSLLRFGLSDRFELRIVTEISTIKNETKVTGLNPVELGYKINIFKEKGLLPTTSLIGHLSIPGLASEKFKSTYYAPSFRFTMQNSLTDFLALGYNVGAEWDGESAEPIFIYTSTIGISIINNLSGFLELYGFAPQEAKAEHRFDGGLTFLIRKNLQLDLSGGIGISDNAPDHFIGLGVSLRFPD